MASLVLSGDTSGSITLAAPAVAGSTTQTLVNVTGTLAPIVSGTAITLTNQTAPDFTSIPSWAKRITVMLSAVSTNGTSQVQIQIGAGSFTTSGYVSTATTGTTSTFYTSGFGVINAIAAADTFHGAAVLTLVTGNTWALTSLINRASSSVIVGAGTLALSGTLDRVRMTTINGTDQFDAGTINILYE